MRARLLDTRVGLLTLTGPGGSGKTRLAVEVGGALRDAYLDGVWFVDLSALRDARLVLPTVAHDLELPENGPSTIDRVHHALKDWRCLLVLDNFEQVLPAATELADVLVACPGVQMLVTSREPLRLRWEYELPVPPLSLPDPRLVSSPAELSRSPAVALFLERARAVTPGLQVTAQNAAAIVAICTRLDGLPLAIELAAAHSRLLPPQALLARLEGGLNVLADPAGDRAARHRTMVAAIAWSTELLAPSERAAFARLSVFAGGFTADAASWIVDDADAVLGALAEKSLLRAEDDGHGEVRLRMLQTIRAYAFEQLERSGERRIVSGQHARWCLDLVAQAEPQLRGPEQVHWLARLDREHDNMRAALAWTLDSGDVESALRLAGSLWRYWSTRGFFLEGQRWLERALQAAQDRSVSTATHARALTAAGEMAWGRGDFDRARACHEASLELRRELDDRPGVAQALQYLANLAMERGEVDLAWTLHEAALDQRRALGVTRDIAVSLQNLGRLAATRGDLDAATRMLEEALTLSRGAMDEIGEAAALRELGEVALRQGQVDRAAGLLHESLRLAREVGAQWTIARGLECLALVAGARRQLPVAVRLLGSADALRDQLRSPQLPTERASVERTLMEARAQMGEAAFEANFAIGRATLVEDAVRLLDEPVGPITVTTTVLSPRELEVVALIAQGLTNRQIAERLVISERTTHAHVRNILDKLDLGSRTQVATWAVEHGLPSH